jgi:hypothetical protein
MDRVMFAVVALSSTVVFSGPIVFSERSEFENAFDNLVIESFEEPVTEGSTVSFAGFSVTESSNFANIKSRTDYVSDGDQSIGFTWNGETQLVFDFNPPIDAFAVDVLDFGTCCSAETLDVTSDTGEISLVAAVGVDLPRGNLQFFGIQTDEPFSKLTFTSQSLSDNDLIVFDRVAFHAVPEPQSYALTIEAIIGLSFLGRARRCMKSFL